MFRDLGYIAYDHGNINESVNMFSKAIQTSKYFLNRYDVDLAKNLQGLSLAHAEKGDYQVAKPLIVEATEIVKRNDGRATLEYCQIRISEAKI